MECAALSPQGPEWPSGKPSTHQENHVELCVRKRNFSKIGMEALAIYSNLYIFLGLEDLST